MSDIDGLPAAYTMMENIGEITGRAETARLLVRVIRESLAALPSWPELNAAYFIWKDPLMSVGPDTFIHQIMALAGFRNVFGQRARYPEISAADLQKTNPQVILLSSEPYPFGPKHQAELAATCPEARVILVDGEMFSWYGSRLRHTAAYLTQLRNKLAKPS